MATIAQLNVEINADSKKAISGLNDLSTKMQGLGKNIGSVGKDMTKYVTGPIVALGAGMLMLANKTGDYADRILDLNAITGMSTDAIQEWQHVSKVAGVETEAVTSAVEGLVRRLPQMEAEGGKATESLNKMGLSFKDLDAMNPDEMVNTLIGELANMPDELERNAIGSQLFGGAWKDLAPILAMGSEGIDEARQKAHDLGSVMDGEGLNSANDYRIAMEELKTEFGNTFRELAMNFLPILKDDIIPFIQQSVIPAFKSFIDLIVQVIDWFKGLSPETQKFIGIAIMLVASLGPVLMIVGKVITVLGLLMSPIGLIIIGIGAVIAIGVLLWKNWDKIIGWAKNLWTSLKTNFDNIKNKIFDTFKSIDLFQIGKDIIKGLANGITNMIGNVVNAVKNTAKKVVDGVKSFFKIGSPSKVMMGFGEDVGEGFAIGMGDAEDKLARASKGMGTVTMGNLADVPTDNANFAISIGDELKNMTIELDDEKVGKFVDRRVIKGVAYV